MKNDSHKGMTYRIHRISVPQLTDVLLKMEDIEPELICDILEQVNAFLEEAWHGKQVQK